MALIVFLSSYWFPIFWCLFIRLIKLDFTLSWLTVNRQTAFPAKKSLIYKEIPRDKTYDSGGKQLLIISSVRVKIKRTTYAGLKSTRCRKKHYFLWAEAVIVESHLPAQRVYNDKLYEMMPLNLINLNALIIPQPCDRWLSKTKLLLPSAVPLTWCRRRFWWDLFSSEHWPRLLPSDSGTRSVPRLHLSLSAGAKHSRPAAKPWTGAEGQSYERPDVSTPSLRLLPTFTTTTTVSVPCCVLSCRYSALFSFCLLRFVLKELIQTEKDYVKDLGIVVEVRHPHIYAYMCLIVSTNPPANTSQQHPFSTGNVTTWSTLWSFSPNPWFNLFIFILIY